MRKRTHTLHLIVRRIEKQRKTEEIMRITNLMKTHENS